MLCICAVIRIFTVHILDSQGCKVFSCGQRRLGSDCADAQADLSLRWVHMSEGSFFMLRRLHDCHFSGILALKATSDENVEEALCIFKRDLGKYTVDDTLSAAQEVFVLTNSIWCVPYLP